MLALVHEFTCWLISIFYEMLQVKKYRVEAVRENLHQSSLIRLIITMLNLAACAR